MKKLFLLLAVVGMLCTACEALEGLDDPSNLKIQLSGQTIDAEFGAGEYSVYITAPCAWTAESQAEWITIKTEEVEVEDSNEEIEAKNLNKQLSFSVDSNTEESAREGVIVIKNEEFQLFAELTIKQKAFVPEITITPQSLNFPFKGGTKTIFITANFDYEVAQESDWLSIENNGNEINVTASASGLSEERTAEITISNEKYKISEKIVVSQNALAYEEKNAILYTSTNNEIVEPYAIGAFGANIVSNTYENGQGVIKFDGDVTMIGQSAFAWCYSLTSIIIPDSVTSIGMQAFHQCESLASITIPNSVTSIGWGAFVGCLSLEAFYGELASEDNRCLIVDGVLTSFAPAKITEYTIPNGVTSIERSAFYYCRKLTKITIPDSVTSIGENAFSRCSSLTSITIPNSVTSIGEWAFQVCISLTSVYCKPTNPPTGGNPMFLYYNNGDYVPIGCKIYVPRNSVEAYKAALYWSDYADYIEGYDF